MWIASYVITSLRYGLIELLYGSVYLPIAHAHTIRKWHGIPLGIHYCQLKFLCTSGGGSIYSDPSIDVLDASPLVDKPRL